MVINCNLSKNCLFKINIKEQDLKKKIIIGRKDKASLPDLGITQVDIKLDTGAYTSAIHCHKIEKKLIDGKEVLTFTLLDPSHDQYLRKEFSTEKFKIKQVKNSFGQSEKRYIIDTKILLFETLHPIQLSLSERGKMRFPLLIGRRFIMGKFVVDPSKYDLSFKKKKSTISIKSIKPKT